MKIPHDLEFRACQDPAGAGGDHFRVDVDPKVDRYIVRGGALAFGQRSELAVAVGAGLGSIRDLERCQ
jgi:hypothetical protein